MRADFRSVDKDGWYHERFFLTTFFVLLKVSDGWALSNYLLTVRNINYALCAEIQAAIITLTSVSKRVLNFSHKNEELKAPSL